MTKKSHALLLLTGFGLIDAILPFFPILAFVLIYVLLERPPWFLDWVRDIYNEKR